MGVDWFRMRPRPGVSTHELRSLIESQARAAQASSWYLSRDLMVPTVAADVQQRLTQQFVESSTKLRDLLEFPTCDSFTGIADDDPELVPSMRVYPITYTSIFPIRCRVEAYRSYLPDTLHAQLKTWSSWLTAIKKGENRAYQSELYLHQLSFEIVDQYRELTRLAEASRSHQAKWTTRPELVQVRDSIPSLRCPSILIPSENVSDSSEELPHERAEFQEFFAQVKLLSDVSNAWNRNARGNWKVTNAKLPTFEEFLNQADAPWLQEFITWAQACSERGMGLFLDG